MISFPKCDFCIRKHYEDNDDRGLIIYCDAFPDGKPWIDIPDDEWEECANGIKFADENGEREYKEYVPNPDSILEKMFIVSGREWPWERDCGYKKK